MDYNLIQDMVDHLFINYTRPARLCDLIIYMLFIFIPFFVQVCIPNDPLKIDYTATPAAFVIRFCCTFAMLGQLRNFFEEIKSMLTHYDYDGNLLNHFGPQNTLDLLAILY